MGKQKKNAILCPNCKSLISRNESRCPYCGVSHPGTWWKHNFLTQGFRDSDYILMAIIYTNIGIYVLSLFLNIRGASVSPNPLALLSPDIESLKLLGAAGVMPIKYGHKWWTLVSANYLHAGILHILFNMFALRQLGPLVIEEYGIYRMFVIYTLGGIFGFLVSYLFKTPLTIGASAAICSLIGAVLYFGKSRGGAYGQIIFRQIGGWAIGIFIFGLLVPGIDNWGHGGGMLGGAILGFLLGYQERKKENLSHKLLAGVCMIVTAVVLGYAIVNGIYLRIVG
ncbi:MAG: rhomboid family intramembrane serine protease [Deltaproteobacteria bacterium]|nr:rhomboid family intramembrane serine protease [Deltaproteobacteria bacterium]